MELEFYSDYHESEINDIKRTIVPLMEHRAWDPLDSKDAHEFAFLMHTILDRRCGVDALEKFEVLPDFINRTKHQLRNNKGWHHCHNSDVMYLNLSRKKTIISFSGIEWTKSLVQEYPYMHSYRWMEKLIHTDYKDFNLLSFSEDISRAYKNPLIYESYYYEGINEKVPSLRHMANLAIDMFPDSEYYIIADCKNAHAAAIFASFVHAKKCLLISPVTDINIDYLYNESIDANNKIGIRTTSGIRFQLLLRALAFCSGIPKHFENVYEVAKISPDTDFRIAVHKDDDDFFKFPLYDNSLSNLSIDLIDNTSQVHYIVPELQKNGYIQKYFNE